MNKNVALIFLGVSLYCCPLAFADNQVWQSGLRQTSLLELFTSEGCSSCPAADQMFSRLRATPDLWTAVVPVAYHVDYWNGLGWPDRLSSAQFTQRQKEYVASWQSRQVYTPMLVRNGGEYYHGTGGAEPQENVGLLTVERTGQQLFQLRFVPSSRSGDVRYVFHAAILGFDISSDVTHGENSGRTLRHDFATLLLKELPAQKQPDVDFWQAQWGWRQDDLLLAADSLGFAVWVTVAEDSKPIQVVGGYL